METISSLMKRAEVLRDECHKVDSVTPELLGGLHYDTLEFVQNLEMLQKTLGIRKVYTSVTAMNADNDLVATNGMALKFGQLVMVHDGVSDSSSADNGKVYVFQGVEAFPKFRLVANINPAKDWYDGLALALRGEGKSNGLYYPFRYLGKIGVDELGDILDGMYSDGNVGYEGKFRAVIEASVIEVTNCCLYYKEQNWLQVVGGNVAVKTSEDGTKSLVLSTGFCFLSRFGKNAVAGDNDSFAWGDWTVIAGPDLAKKVEKNSTEIATEVTRATLAEKNLLTAVENLQKALKGIGVDGEYYPFAWLGQFDNIGDLVTKLDDWHATTDFDDYSGIFRARVSVSTLEVVNNCTGIAGDYWMQAIRGNVDIASDGSLKITRTYNTVYRMHDGDTGWSEWKVS